MSGRTVLFIPPLSRMSGGLATLYAVADSLRHSGRAVSLTCPGMRAAGFSDMVRKGLDVLPWEGLTLASSDLWLVPESWPNAVSVGVTSGASTVVYAQSWNFLLTTLPEGVRWKRLPVRFLAVSHPVAWFMEQVLEVDIAGILSPAVDPVFFAEDRPFLEKKTLAGTVRVAWMPRKNSALADLVRQVATAALARHSDAPAVEWVAVQNLSLREVAECFASCHIFLCTAFPEGFGLPPLEAMASGCVPVGFTGFGGWEYMRQAFLPEMTEAAGAFSLCAPPCPLPSKPWEGNGFFFADGDVMGAGLGLAAAVRLAGQGGDAWRNLVHGCGMTARAYSARNRDAALLRLWDELLEDR